MALGQAGLLPTGSKAQWLQMARGDPLIPDAYPRRMGCSGCQAQPPREDSGGQAEVGPLGPCCHRQRAPAVAQVRARGGPLPGFRRNRAGCRVWKLPPAGIQGAPVAFSCLSELRSC